MLSERASYKDLTRLGTAKLVEAPYSGHMLELGRTPEEELLETPDGYQHHITMRFRRRWQSRRATGVDIFEVVFHLHEFLDVQGGRNRALLDGVNALLSNVGSWEDVSLQTMQRAAANWEGQAEANKAARGAVPQDAP